MTALVLAFVRTAALLAMLPVWNATSSPRWVGPLCALGCAAVFLGTGQHLALLGAVAESFVRWPLGTGPSLGLPTAVFVNEAFVLGVQMAGPLTIGGLLMQLFLGLLTKTAPRLQAFFAVGPTLTALAGLFLFAASLPWLLTVHQSAVADAVDRVRHWFTGG